VRVAGRSGTAWLKTIAVADPGAWIVVGLIVITDVIAKNSFGRWFKCAQRAW
jgi:hypothetical protein